MTPPPWSPPAGHGLSGAAWLMLAASVIGTLLGRLLHIATLALIRRGAAAAQAFILTKGAGAPPPLREESIMAGGSLLNRFIFGPIKSLWAGAATSNDPQVRAAVAAVATVITTDLAAVNPLFDVAAAEIENALDKLVQSLGPVGVLADATVVHPAMSLGAGALKQLIDHKLGIAPLPPTAA